jgi:hypothetical protein
MGTSRERPSRLLGATLSAEGPIARVPAQAIRGELSHGRTQNIWTNWHRRFEGCPSRAYGGRVTRCSFLCERSWIDLLQSDHALEVLGTDPLGDPEDHPWTSSSGRSKPATRDSSCVQLVAVTHPASAVLEWRQIRAGVAGRYLAHPS